VTDAAEDKQKVAAPDEKAIATTKQFVDQHGKPVRAVVENIGRIGARVVLVGADGAMGDVVVEGPAVGDALVEAVPGVEAASWDTTTVAATKIGSAHRRKMAGPRAKR
jgi:hypothetical protein